MEIRRTALRPILGLTVLAVPTRLTLQRRKGSSIRMPKPPVSRYRAGFFAGTHAQEGALLKKGKPVAYYAFTPAHSITLALASLFALIVCTATSGLAESAETSMDTKGASDADGKPTAARSLSLADIAAKLEAMDTSERDMRRRLAESARDEAQVSEIDAAERALSQTGHVGVNAPADLVEYFEAMDLEITIRNIVNRLDPTIETIAERARQLDEDLDRLASGSAQSNAWLATARLRQAPAASLAAIEAVPKRGDELARQIRAERDRLLQILDRAQRLRRGAEISQAEVADRKLALAAHLRTASDAPVWRISATPGEFDRSLQAARSRAARILDHLRQHALIVLAITIVAFSLCYALIMFTRRRLAHDDGTDPYAGARSGCSMLRSRPRYSCRCWHCCGTVRWDPSRTTKS